MVLYKIQEYRRKLILAQLKHGSHNKGFFLKKNAMLQFSDKFEIYKTLDL